MSEQSTRRDFLCDSAMTGAALVLPSLVPAHGLGKDAGVSPSETITLGVIGIGPRCTYDLKAILGMSDVRCVAIADVQDLNDEPGAASAIDLILDNTSPSTLERTQNAVETLVAERAGHRQHKIVSAAARQKVLDEAERITRILLVLVAFVALLTSFFIILTTMSMSLFERRRLLGVMRCVG